MDVIGNAYTPSPIGYIFSVRHKIPLAVIGYCVGMPLTIVFMSFHPNCVPDLHSIRDTCPSLTITRSISASLLSR